MSRSLIIEEERGTYLGHAHPHNGYYAGDFSAVALAPSASGSSTPSRPLTVPAPARFPAASPKAVTAIGQRLDTRRADR